MQSSISGSNALPGCRIDGEARLYQICCLPMDSIGVAILPRKAQLSVHELCDADYFAAASSAINTPEESSAARTVRQVL